MTDCSKVPTLDDIESSKSAMSDIEKFTYFTTDTFVDSNGVTRDTVTGRMKTMGYSVPIPYVAGIIFTTVDNVKTVEEGGVTYAPLLSSLPFTTSGTFTGGDDARFFTVQGVTDKSLINDLSQEYAFNTVIDMELSQIVFPLIKRLTTGGAVSVGDNDHADYIVESSKADSDNDVQLTDGKWANWQHIADNQTTPTLYQDAPTDAQIQFIIDNAPYASVLKILNKSAYSNAINWKGLRHESSDLPHLVNSVTINGGNLNARMVVDNGILYNCGYSTNRIEMFTLDDPRNPRQFSTFAVGSQPRHVAVIGEYLIVCCHGASEIQFHETSSVSGGGLIGTIPTHTNPKMFELDGNTLYIPCAASPFKLQKYTFVLPSGDVPFSYKLEAEALTGNTPLCAALNGDGLIAVTGLGDLVNLYGTNNLNSISDTVIGGVGHGTCVWKTKTQLLVSDATLNQVHSVSFTSITTPTISSSVNVVSNPEQITIVGDRFYVPQLETVGGISKLSAVDMVDNRNLFEYKQVELSVKDAGFTAYYDKGGENGYLYVNGHASPYNIDVIEIVKGEFVGNQQNAMINIYSPEASFDDASISNLKSNTATASYEYRTATSNTNTTINDNTVRLGTGANAVLHDPELYKGQELTLVNVHDVNSSNITNAFSGFSGTLQPFASVVLRAMDFNGVFQWDAISSHGSII